MAFMQIASIGQVAFLILVWAIVTECIDYQEYTSHERADGTVYSIYTFSRKIGSAISYAGTRLFIKNAYFIGFFNVPRETFILIYTNISVE